MIRGTNSFEVRKGVAYIDVSTPKYPEMIATVDEADLDLVMRVRGGRWFAANTGGGGHILYATSTKHVKPGPKIHYRMHRVILDAWDHNEIIDHADGNGLNNCRSNLRFATRTQNAANSRLRPTNKTGLRGVSECSKTGRFTAQISHEGKSLFLGNWDDALMAAAAYDGAARALHGPFAKMNFRENNDDIPVRSSPAHARLALNIDRGSQRIGEDPERA